ncbi:hypothetical protein JK628_02430 [Shewanella sp. KX20019]|uniref:hypothetical protein n=1 Tax=Shewanella sp. KX20019 TaxID=2803864 RepID=UPI001925AC4E|nr:hypothetical protein [Shewanella sp. KX20019]QQX80750.1 hypothetical protein JK628_02430 [Shewanella sp. KX20019]
MKNTLIAMLTASIIMIQPVVAQTMTETATATATAVKLPPAMFISTINSDDIYDKIRLHQAFTDIDKESLGNPIKIYVHHRLEATAGGTAAGLTSAMLAGGSLGLLPVVVNNDLVLTYELRVNNQSLAKFEYRENFTDAINIYQDQGPGGLDDSALAWAVSTVDQFTAAVIKDPKILSLIEEYNYYFAVETPSSE